MTTLGRYRGMDVVLERLEAVRWRHFLVQVALAAAGIATVVLGGLFVLGVAGGYWPGQPPAALRWGLLLGASTAWAGAFVWFAVLPLRRRLNYTQTARLIEQRLGGLHNALTNALQLATDEMISSRPSEAPMAEDRDFRPLVQKAIEETVLWTGKAPLTAAVELRSLKRWCIAAAVAALALAAFGGFQGPRLARGLSAVFRPGAYVRHLGSVRLISLEPGDARLFAGQRLTIVARIDNPQRRRYRAWVEIAGAAAPRTMLASPDRTTYSCILGEVEQSFRYAVHIGDSKFPAAKPYYALTVVERVPVEGLDVTYTFPRYLKRRERTVVNAAGPIEAPMGTRAKVQVRLGSPVPGAVLEMRGGRRAPMRRGEDGRSFTGELRVLSEGGYRILLTDAAGRTLQQLPDVGGNDADAARAVEGYYPIRAVPDAPPKIAFIEPNRDVSVAPGGRLLTRLRAGDDYALAEVKFFLGREGEPARMVRRFAQAVGKSAATLEHVVEVGGEYRTGEVIVYYAVATDGRRLGRLGGPQTTESPRFKILVQDAAKVAAERARRYERLRARLLAILAAQEKQRVSTRIAAEKLAELSRVRAAGREIEQAQRAIRADILDVVERFPFEPEMVTIQQALAVLGNNEAALAVTQAQVLAGLDRMSSRPAACRALGATQEKIIRSLQTLLAILPSLANPESVKQAGSGDDLPPEVREKLSALQQDLERFIEQQRKVIRASERLVKKPVDAFTSEDQQLLRELQLAQDKWEKFLNEKFADFSKLAQQDFSNPVLLKELISVKTDVTMAKDALSKKAVEIATAIEDNGVENAATLTANIEKWLPDEPDRIKWDMEDPAGQTSIEQPELPKELEDLVGDLLEDEEDLFEEMDDITSKYAMSGDKGIGWDAMDGPISNMNAQGVTGNQLPNTSEISGRSGEGRQGKSLGEFVEDKAVGKGGRRTPTRLTPEPFQQGQVNDTSAEPAGGATGGGKLSGGGSEGLEGPLPPPLKRQLKRLAGKHAQLLNRAERIQAAFRVSDYSNYQFLQTITLMNRVQHDLANYRYRNALRQRDVLLSGLRRTRLLLAGKIDVTADATANMPKHVKDDIADAMKAKLPAAYRDVLKSYFQRLAEAGR